MWVSAPRARPFFCCKVSDKCQTFTICVVQHPQGVWFVRSIRPASPTSVLGCIETDCARLSSLHDRLRDSVSLFFKWCARQPWKVKSDSFLKNPSSHCCRSIAISQHYVAQARLSFVYVQVGSSLYASMSGAKIHIAVEFLGKSFHPCFRSIVAASESSRRLCSPYNLLTSSQGHNWYC